MAVNKRKILESAQKHLQKGALDKALEDYQTLLRADSKDSNVRLKVGDLQLKLGRNQDAIDCYLRVAQQFTAEGFDAKAVALYKQITKLDDKRFEVHTQLGELYQRMGLSSEAMKALQLAADGAYRAGDKPQALGLLRKMAALDPTNTTSRQKVADLLRQEGQPEESIAEYEEIAKELERQRNGEEHLRVLERMLEIAPARPETLRALSKVAAEAGSFARAESAARKLLEANGDDIDALQLLGQALEGAGRASDAADVFRGVAERYRARGDEDRARELIQRYGAAGALSVDDSEPALVSGDADELELDAEEAPPLALDAAAEAEGEGADTDWLDTPVEEEPAASPEAEPEAPVDLEQLLAEASVLLRYGKHDRAVETLRAALRVEPGNPSALEKLGEALLAGGNRAHATSALQRALEGFAEAGDRAGAERVRQLLAKADPKAAAAVAVAPPPAAAPEVEAPEEDSGEIDIDLDANGLGEDSGAEQAARGESADFSGIEIDAGEISFEDAPSEPSPSGAAPEPLIDDPAAFSFREDEEEATPPVPEPAPVAKPAPRVAPPPARPAAPEPRAAPAAPVAAAAPAAPSVEGDLEEAEFYRAQGLLAEARELYERVLAALPNHPQAQRGLAELEAASAAAQPASATEQSFEIDVDDSTPAVQGPAPKPQPAAKHAPVAPAAPAAAGARAAGKRDADETVPALPAPGEAPLAGLGAADFDLAAELSGAIHNARAPAQPGGTEAEAFQEVFAAFKAGVRREVGEADFEAHYDLGIAYKEMGLLDDAIGEFKAALGGGERRVACLHLMGLCALELGRAGDAVAHFSQALAGGALPPQQEAALRVDLGAGYAAAGDLARARAAYQAAQTLDPGPELARRIAELEAAPPPARAAARASEEALESFDDLIEESAPEREAAPAAPAYESFDDLVDDEDDAPPSAAPPAAEEPAIEEIALEPASEEPAADEPPSPAAPRVRAEAPAPSEPPAVGEAPAAKSPSSPTPPARRKKKISFV